MRYILSDHLTHRTSPAFLIICEASGSRRESPLFDTPQMEDIVAIGTTPDSIVRIHKAAADHALILSAS